MSEEIRNAFSKVKQDIFSLGDELNRIKLMLADMKNELKIITQAINDIREKEFLTEKQPEITKITEKTTPSYIPTQKQEVPTIQQTTPTHFEIPTDKLLSYVLKRQILPISIGNQGVPTNKQTNKQTNQQIIQHIKEPILTRSNYKLTTTKPLKIGKKSEIPTTKESRIDQLSKIDEILNSLDALKKELRFKIKRLTSQEMAVFSLLYSLENEGNEVDYPLLASKLQLSEASIRDYIGKIQRKGIPISKEKLNNKKIILHLSQDFKKIASLDTIIKLREL